MSKGTTTRAATKYPSLFNNYWGAFTLPRNGDAITPEIIDNRNRFVEEFGVSRQANNRALGPFYNNQSRIDHQESYKCTNGKIILICSNYAGDPPAEFGMAPYLPLYTTTATTYIRVFANAVEMRAVMKGTEQ